MQRDVGIVAQPITEIVSGFDQRVAIRVGFRRSFFRLDALLAAISRRSEIHHSSLRILESRIRRSTHSTN